MSLKERKKERKKCFYEFERKKERKKERSIVKLEISKKTDSNNKLPLLMKQGGTFL